MANFGDIERIAKMIARADRNDNKNEAEVAIRSAYARMKRDGVTIEDLLSLPIDALFQKGLNDLAAYVIAERDDLSESSKAQLYSDYVLKIAAKFSGGYESNHDETRDERGSQHRYEEQGGGATASASQADSESVQWRYVFSAEGLKSVAREVVVISASSVQRGGFFWYALREPVATLRLLAVAALFGLGGGLLLLFLAASLHSWLNIGGPWIDMKFVRAWIFAGTVCGLAKLVYLYRSGWYR